MNTDYAKYEGYIPGNDEPRWNQSFYYQAYDPVTRTGAFIRIGLLENQKESNSWLIVFRDGRPLYTRTNLNLPENKQRPLQGIEIAGMSIRAEVPLKKTRITFDSPDFSMNLVWDELAPMEDCIAMTQDTHDGFAKEIAQIHLEGTSHITGHITHRGQRQDFDGKGFRDIAAGVRNWDGLNHYRLAWPVFENGMAFAGIHGISTGGQSAYMRMMYDGTQWRRVKAIEDHMSFDAEGFAVTEARWTFIDDANVRYEMSGRPLFNWLFPFDTFVLREQLMEFRLADGTLGYGLYETGYRLPWTPT
ncbi:MAG: DUF7065 domain-containing protein [Panacagrimonas sp.]